MEVVFFFYGLAFFVLGLAVFFSTDTTSKYKLTPCLWLLAMFGLLHGVNEWLDMVLLDVVSHNLSTTIIMWLKHFGFFLTAGSFLFLLAFGIQALIVINKPIISRLNKLTVILCALLLVTVIMLAIFFDYHNGYTLLKIASIFARYFIGFTGAFLTGLAFLIWRNQPEIKKIESKIINFSFVGMGIAFISYAIFTGLIVPKAAFFPASVFNYPNFIKVFGFPVQVLHTICALTTAICVFGALRIFRYSEKSELVGRAIHDALTKLYNRQIFDSIYMRECDRTKRYKKPLSVLFADIDNFKDYNDTYGHAAGDVLLKLFAQLMLDNARSVDYVFRYGGEEFVILLPETDKKAALDAAERIRSTCEQTKLKPTEHDVETHKTISVGVSTFKPSNKNPSRTIELADQAMYKAKKTGKNKVLHSDSVIDTPETEESNISHDITACKYAETELDRHIKFEQVVSKIAKYFSSLTFDMIDEGIQNSLQIIAEYMGFDRAHIFRFSENQKAMDCKYEWCAKDIPPLINHLQNFDLTNAQQFVKTIMSKNILTILDIKSLSPAWRGEQDIWKNLNIKSLVCFPLTQDNKRIGFIGFDTIQERKEWNEDDTSLINTYNEIITAALERKESWQKLEHSAKFDTLTNLPNRLNFEETLDREIAEAKKHNYSFAFLLIDLDKFKFINNTFGRHVGDLFLIEIAQRLRKLVRKKDFLARLECDKFAIIASKIRSINDVDIIAKKIIKTIGKKYNIKKHKFISSTSIGIATYPNDGNNIEALMRSVNAATHYAKQHGGNNYKHYHKKLSKQHREKLQMENEINKALKNDEFFLSYQPRFNLINKKITGIEALICWQHPKLGLLYPKTFIPLAEEGALIIDIGLWVIKTALNQYKQWCKKFPQFKIPLAINLSAVQLSDKDLLSNITDVLKHTRVKASQIELELTETAIMTNPASSEKMLRSLANKGFKIVIDDFGTGYSSLSRLKQPPVSTLKIDASFVKDIDIDYANKIIQSIIALAKAIGLDVIAEGIENERQLKFLIDNDCHEGQGFYFSKPLTIDKMDKLLQK
jgi:diguanylate cyclase (GGDEF)-like protein